MSDKKPDATADVTVAPDDPSSSSERLLAARFASLCDDATRGVVPAAADLEQREMIEAVTALRSAYGREQIDDETAQKWAAQAIAGATQAATGASTDELAVQRKAKANRSSRLPWAIAAASSLVAAAAIVLLLISRRGGVQAQSIPLAWQSRPADAVVGMILPADAGAAAARIDQIYDDRLSGYRSARLFSLGVTQ